MDLKAIQDRIVELGGRMRAILDGSDAVNGMSEAQEKEFDGIDSERKRLLATEERARLLDESENRLSAGEGRRTQPNNPGSQSRGAASSRERRTPDLIDALRSWLLVPTNVALSDEQRSNAQALGVRLDSKQMTINLAPQQLRSLRFDEVQEWEKRALSTLNTSSPVDGYYTIQNELMRPLEEALLAFGGMRRFSTVLRTGTGAALPIPTDNDTANEGEIIAENSTVNEKDVAFNQLVLEAYKYSSKMVRVSIELLQDSTVNLGQYLGRKLGQRIGRITNRHFTVGTGSSQPNGIVVASTASGVQLAAQTPTYAEMVSIQHSVDPAYREMPSAGWMFHDTMLAEVKKIVDASTGRPIWMPNMIGSEPDTILGDPYVVNQHMAVAAGSGAGKSILFGDLSTYQIRDVMGVTLIRLDERYAEYGQVAFLAWSRHDGDLLDAGTHPVKHGLNKA